MRAFVWGTAVIILGLGMGLGRAGAADPEPAATDSSAAADADTAAADWLFAGVDWTAAQPDSVAALLDSAALALPAALDAAADTTGLTLAECLQIALDDNLRYRSQYQDLLSSHATLERARAPFGLQANATLNVPTYSEFRDVEENVALSTRIVENRTNFVYSGQVNLSQRVPYLGEFSVLTSAERQDFSSNLRTDYLDVVGDLRASYSHDLLHAPPEQTALKRAELGFTSARHAYSAERIALEGRVTDAYYQLVQSIRQLDIEQQRLRQSSANLKLAQRKYEIGLIAEVEALRLRVTMLNAEASFAQAQTDIERRRDALREVLGMEMDQPLDVVTQVEFQEYQIDPERALTVGLQRRSDMHQAEITAQVQALNLADTRRRNGINASLNASVSLLGRGDDLDDISRNLGRNYWDVGIQVTMPVLDSGERRGQLRGAQINVEQADLSRQMVRRQIILEIRNAVRNLAEAERQIALRQASLEVSQRTYEVEQRRFELGLAQSQELLDAQAELTTNQIMALDAVIAYQRRLKDLRVATMAELEDLTARRTK